MNASPILIGFIPLLDCAPLAAAAEKGFAAEEGLELTLLRETSWANIRDRLLVGHFDAAHLLGPMAVASTLGVGHIRSPIAAPCSLGLGGNAITASLDLWRAMLDAGAAVGASPAVQGAALRSVVAQRAKRAGEPLTFAMVYPFSCHNYELRYWLAASGVAPDYDVRLVVMPPPLLVDALREGQIDGFCAGDPWNSLAVSVGVGAIVAPTTAIWRFSPEKVLGCRLEWLERRPERAMALVRALHRAAWWCEREEHHAELARLLAQPRYVGAPAEILLQGLANQLRLTPDQQPMSSPDFYMPARCAAGFPWRSHALWFYSQMVRWRQIRFSSAHLSAVQAAYRPDVYRAALQPLGADLPDVDMKVEGGADSGGGFFDQQLFDPAQFERYLAEQSSVPEALETR